MKIENNALYRSNYDYQPVSVSIYPHIDPYGDVNCDLSIEQENKLTNEIRIIDAFHGLKSVRKFFQLNEDNFVAMSQYVELLESVKEDLKKNNLPESLLNNIYCHNDDGYPCLYMLPNNDFPICSILALKNAKNSLLYNGSAITQKRWQLLENYEKKAAELKECTDQNFVAKSLEPLQKKISEFDEQNKEEMAKVKKREDMFNNYLESVGLKTEFDTFENHSDDIQEEAVKPTKTAKKRKV